MNKESWVNPLLLNYEYFFILKKLRGNMKLIHFDNEDILDSKAMKDHEEYVENDGHNSYSIDEVLQFNKHKTLFFWDSFKKLYKALEILREHKILHMNINSSSILYSRDTFEARICNFNNSINNNSINTIQYEDNKYLPFEYHLLCYIKEKDNLKEEDIDIIIQKSMYRLSEKMMKKHEEVARRYINKCIHLDNCEIKDSIMNVMETWDIYSLAVHYLYYITKYNEKHNKINIIINRCEAIISSDPEDRLTIGETAFA